MSTPAITSDLMYRILKTFPFFMRKVFHDFHKQENMGGLTKAQHKTLMLLFFEEEQHMSGLSERLNMEKGSFTAVVEDLVERGLVVRKKDSRDRRKYNLALTETGEKLIDREIAKARSFLAEKLSRLGSEDLDRFTLAVNDLYEITLKL